MRRQSLRILAVGAIAIFTIIGIALVMLSLLDRLVRPVSAPIEQRSLTIGPQFWKYDMSEYERVDSNVVYGLGGRWISVRYRRKSGEAVNRHDMISRISKALTSDGWTPRSLPGYEYVLSTIWETSEDDIHYTRAPRDDEPETWSFSHIIHVSSTGDNVCLYCQVSW